MFDCVTFSLLKRRWHKNYFFILDGLTNPWYAWDSRLIRRWIFFLRSSFVQTDVFDHETFRLAGLWWHQPTLHVRLELQQQIVTVHGLHRTGQDALGSCCDSLSRRSQKNNVQGCYRCLLQCHLTSSPPPNACSFGGEWSVLGCDVLSVRTWINFVRMCRSPKLRTDLNWHPYGRELTSLGCEVKFQVRTDLNWHLYGRELTSLGREWSP